MASARSRAGSDELELGYIAGLFGLRGEVRVFLHNRETELFAQPLDVSLLGPEGERRAARIVLRGGAGERVLGRIDGLHDREEARALMGWQIALPKSALPALEGDEFYHHQLIGLEVVDAAGASLGQLSEIHSTAEVDVWVVRPPRGEELYVPALRERILSVDLAAGRVTVDHDG